MPPGPDLTTPDALFDQLRELCSDVAADPESRARRLAVLRRLERRLGDGDRPRALLVA